MLLTRSTSRYKDMEELRVRGGNTVCYANIFKE